VVVDVLGTVLAIEAPAAVATELRALLVDLRTARPATRTLRLAEEPSGTYRLLDDGVEVRAAVAPVVGAATVVWWLNALAIDNAPHVLVHAGCVGDRSAVVLPGASGAGKSTITAACVADGLTYLSDEYAAIDPGRGTVVPYPRPVELATGLVAASTLGTRPPASLAPGGVVFPRYERGAATAVTDLDPRASFLALVSHTANLPRLGGEAIAWLVALALAAPASQVTYGDDAEARRLVAGLARCDAPPLHPAPVLGPVTPTTTTVALGTDTVVFDATTGSVHLLNPSAALVWLDLVDRTASDAPGTAVRAGVAGDALDGATIDRTLRHLAATGLLPDGSE